MRIEKLRSLVSLQQKLLLTLFQIDGILEFESIRRSNYISNAIMISDLSVKFETLYSDNRVQSYFKSLSLLQDFLACQALMSPALAKLKNAKADFPQQKAYLKDQLQLYQFKVEGSLDFANFEGLQYDKATRILKTT